MHSIHLIYENDSPESYFRPNFQYMEVVCEHLSHIKIFLFRLPQSGEKINLLKYTIGTIIIGPLKVSIQFSKVCSEVFQIMYI